MPTRPADLDAPTRRVVRSLARKFARRGKYVRYIELDDYEQEGLLKVWAETAKRGRSLLPVEAYVAARWGMSMLERRQAGRWTGEARMVGFEARPASVQPPDWAGRIDVADALDLLTDDELEAVRGRYWLGRLAKESAAELGWSVHTINKRLESAHRKIRAYLGCYSEGYARVRSRPRNWRVYGRYPH